MSSSARGDPRHRLVGGDHVLVVDGATVELTAGPPSSTSTSSLSFGRRSATRATRSPSEAWNTSASASELSSRYHELLVEVAVVDVDRHAAHLERRRTAPRGTRCRCRGRARPWVRARGRRRVSAAASRAARSSYSRHVRVTSPFVTAGRSGIASATDSHTVAQCISIAGENTWQARSVDATDARHRAVVSAAWRDYGDPRAIVDVASCRAMVSTNRVYRLTLDDGSTASSRSSNYGSFFLFAEDHDRLHRCQRLLEGGRFEPLPRRRR